MKAGDRRSDDEIGREILKIKAMMADGAKYGGHYHLALGMTWALEWASHRCSSPSHVLKSLSSDDEARFLVKAFEELQCRMAAMVTNDADALFGEDCTRPDEKGGV